MKFSIITINFNGNLFLKEAIDSVLGQQYQDIEYLIIDGGSTDGSLATITEAALSDGRIKWVSEADQGISDAMNKGIRLAHGEIIAFLHADDYYSDSGVLARVASHFTSSKDQSWLTGGVVLVDDQGSQLRVIPARHFTYRRLFRNNIILHPATFVRREVFSDSGAFSPEYSYAMDYDFWLRLAARQYPLVVTDVFACFRVHSGSRSTKYEAKAIHEEWVVRKRRLKSIFGRTLHGLYYLLRIGQCTLRAWLGK